MDSEVRHDVFVSYNRKDKTAVFALAEMLSKRAGLRVWIDKAQLQAGESWRDDIEQAINAARAVLIVLGPDHFGPIQREERGLAYAVRDQRSDFRVIYCLLPNTPPPRGSWANVDTWIQFESALNEPEAFDRLIAALKGEAIPDPLAVELPDQPAPYRGLAAFRENDARFFHGRADVVAEITERLARSPFLAVIGPSGSGKTSVVQAGLFPRLADRVLDGRAQWIRLAVHPGPHPLTALARQLARSDGATANTLADGLSRLHPSDSGQSLERVLVASLEADPRTLPEQLLSALPPETSCLVVVDRLEELFTLCDVTTERQAFVDALLAVATHSATPTRVVITMRADFYGHLAPYAELREQIVDHQLYLSPLTAESIAEVIEAPATEVGAVFEKRLAAQICDDAAAGHEISLPLLQHALDLLWRKRSGRWLTWDSYDEFGGVEGAVRYHADRVVNALGKDRGIAKQLLKRLIWLDERAGTLAGRRVEKSVLVGDDADAPERNRVLQKLADQRLVVVGHEAGGATAELIHDSLPLQWQQLQDWVNEDREFTLWHQRLRSSLDQWRRADRDEGALLRGSNLGEAKRWFRERPNDLTSDERDFVAKGIALQRHAQRLRAFAYSAVVVSFVAAAMTFGWLWRDGEAQRRLAFSRKLAAQAELFIQTPGFLERGVLLAVESLRRAHTAEGDQALRQGLALLPRQLGQIGPFQAINDWALSGDGAWLAIAEPQTGVRIWSTATNEESVPMEPAANVTGVAFADQGRIIAVVIENGPVRLWAWQERPQRLITELDQPNGAMAVALNPRGDRIATSDREGAIHIWSLENGKAVLQNTLGGADGEDEGREGKHQVVAAPVNSIALGPDRPPRLIAETPVRGVAIYDSEEGTIGLSVPEGREPHLWDLFEKTKIGPAYPSSVVTARGDPFVSFAPVVLSPDGRWMATGTLITDRNDLRAWIWETGDGRVKTGLPHDQIVHAVAFRPNSEWLLTGTDYGLLSIWDWKAGRKINELPLDVDINGIAFDTSGLRLVLHTRGAKGRFATQFGAPGEEATAHSFRALLMGHEIASLAVSPGTSLRFTEDSRFLEVLEHGGDGAQSVLTTSILDISTGAKRESEQEIPGFVRWRRGDVAGGRTFAVEEDARGVTLTVSGSEFAAPITLIHDGYEDFVTMWISSDTEWLVSWISDDEDGLLSLWRLRDGRLTAQFPCDEIEDMLDCELSYSARHDWLAIRDSEETVHLWDLAARRSIWEMRGRRGVFAADGNLLRGSPVFSLDVRALLNHSGASWLASESGKGIRKDVRGVALSADGELAATAHPEGLVNLWRASNGSVYKRIIHDKDVHSLVFSPDGTLLATASGDKGDAATVHLIDVETGQDLARIDAPYRVQSLAISPDRRWIAAAGQDQLTVWTLSPVDLVAEACRRLSRSLTDLERMRFLFDEKASPSCP